MNSYFRPSTPPSAHRLADCTFPFVDTDPVSTRAAYEAACAVALEAGAHVVAWRRPRVPGPWSGVVRVGDVFVSRPS